jgi:hypothetical protein
MANPETAERAAAVDSGPAIDGSARVVGYRQAHQRVDAARGRASSYPCAECGRPAQDWAYLHDDPDELVAVVNGRPLRYSLDSDRYSPLCRCCHRRLDRAMRVFASW